MLSWQGQDQVCPQNEETLDKREWILGKCLPRLELESFKRATILNFGFAGEKWGPLHFGASFEHKGRGVFAAHPSPGSIHSVRKSPGILSTLSGSSSIETTTKCPAFSKRIRILFGQDQQGRKDESLPAFWPSSHPVHPVHPVF
jgi:hypothetical protein